MKVLWVHRRSRVTGNFSIERCFREIRQGVDQLEAPDIVIEEISLPHPTSGLLSVLRNILFAMHLKADVVHITGDVYYVLPFLRARRKVVTIHDLGVLTEQGKKGLARWILKTLWFSWPIFVADAVICVSVKTLERLDDLFPDKNHSVRIVIPTAVPFPKVFNSFPLPAISGIATVLQIGTAPNKNLNRVWDACEGLNVQLLVVGPSSEEWRKRQSSSLLKVEFFEKVTDEELEALYCRSDVVAFVSLHEGFGMPLIEAQLIGVPCVSSNIEPMRSNAGEGAYLVGPDDTDSIRAAILRILSNRNDANELVIRGRANAQRFVGKVVAKEYLQLYRLFEPLNELQ
jgi:glycosyltransferase involved in cell wall biosynthesis